MFGYPQNTATPTGSRSSASTTCSCRKAGAFPSPAGATWRRPRERSTRIGNLAGQGERQSLLVVDELGRLELIRNQGLTSALALLDEGPNPAFPHALIVVRDVLVDLARERFAPSWGDPALVSPTQDAEEAIRRAFKATR